MRKSPHLGRYVLASSVAAALIVSPLALASGEGDNMRMGARNPSDNQSQELSRETQIIANNSTYGTRQSNKSDNGGGAIYGCRSKAGGTPKGNEPCIRSNNLADGLAFEFETDGALGGTIAAIGGDNAKPFVTNATGVATGLNADRVDSKNADDLTNDAVKAVAAVNPFAVVDATGKAVNSRGATSTAKTATGTYTVVFDRDVSACAFSAVESQTSAIGPVGISVGTDKKTVTVVTHDQTNAAADSPFNLTATC